MEHEVHRCLAGFGSSSLPSAIRHVQEADQDRIDAAYSAQSGVAPELAGQLHHTQHPACEGQCSVPMPGELDADQDGYWDRPSECAAGDMDSLIANVYDRVASLQASLEEGVDCLRRDLEDLSVEYDGRLQEVEHGLHGIVQEQDVRQQVNHVSERVLRLAMQTRRVGFSQGGLADEEARELRSELSTVGEDLAGLCARMVGVEQGLQGMAVALDRVCEELGTLRARADHPNQSAEDGISRLSQGISHHDERDQDFAPEEADNCAHGNGDGLSMEKSRADPEAEVPGCSQETPTIRRRMEDMERNLHSVAEVVWELRCQQAGGPRCGRAGNSSHSPKDSEPSAAREAVGKLFSPTSSRS